MIPIERWSINKSRVQKGKANLAFGEIYSNYDDLARHSVIWSRSELARHVSKTLQTTSGSVIMTTEKDIEKYIANLGNTDRQIKLKSLKRLQEMGSAAARSVPQIIPLLNDETPKVRAWAARALGYIGPEAVAAVPALIGVLDDKVTNVRSSAACALGQIGEQASPAVPALQKALTDPKWSVRITASIALGSLGPCANSALNDLVRQVSHADNFDERGSAWQAIKAILGDDFGRQMFIWFMDRMKRSFESDHLDERHAALEFTKAFLGDDLGSETLLQYSAREDLLDENPLVGEVRDRVVEKRLPQKETVTKYLLGLKDADAKKRSGAMKKLSNVVCEKQEDLNLIVIRAVPEILALLRDPSWKVRSWAARLLGRIGHPADAAIPHLIAALEDQSVTVRECAAFALGSLGPKAESAIPALEKALHDPNREVRTHAHMSLRHLRHKDPLTEKLYDDDKFVCYKIDDNILDIYYYEAGYGRHARPR